MGSDLQSTCQAEVCNSPEPEDLRVRFGHERQEALEQIRSGGGTQVDVLEGVDAHRAGEGPIFSGENRDDEVVEGAGVLKFQCDGQ